jgi:hypothetical protein
LLFEIWITISILSLHKPLENNVPNKLKSGQVQDVVFQLVRVGKTFLSLDNLSFLNRLILGGKKG